MKELMRIKYGSYLYGTNTPESDIDLKVVYLPEITDMLIGKQLKIVSEKQDKLGKAIGPNVPMTKDDIDIQYIPVQIYLQDFTKGQTYAVEMAMEFLKDEYSNSEFYSINKYLVEHFLTDNIAPMVGFAMKSTFDYCQRGERLKIMQDIMSQLTTMEKKYGGETQLSKTVSDKTLMEAIAKKQKLEMKEQDHGQISLEVNGRSYMATTTIAHLKGQVQKKIDKYGQRTTDASIEEVDWKSLSHAVRVFQQIVELVQYGKMTFPRPNAKYLLSIKQGNESAEEIRKLLIELDEQVKFINDTKSSGLPSMISIQDSLNEWKKSILFALYKLA